MTHMSSCYTLQDSAMHFHAHLEEGCARLYIFRGEIVEEVEEGSQEKWGRLSGSSKQTIKPGAVFSVAQKPGTVLLTYVISLYLSGHTREGIIFFFLSPCSTRPSRWTLVKRVSECFGLICSTDQIVLLTEPVFSCLFRFFLCEYLRVKMYLQFKGQDILASKESLLALTLLVLQVFIIYIIYSFYELWTVIIPNKRETTGLKFKMIFVLSVLNFISSDHQKTIKWKI